jgi:hypothetical protein
MTHAWNETWLVRDRDKDPARGNNAIRYDIAVMSFDDGGTDYGDDARDVARRAAEDLWRDSRAQTPPTAFRLEVTDPDGHTSRWRVRVREGCGRLPEEEL